MLRKYTVFIFLSVQQTILFYKEMFISVIMFVGGLYFCDILLQYYHMAEILQIRRETLYNQSIIAVFFLNSRHVCLKF